MVEQPVDRRRGGHEILEDALPLREGQVAGEQDAAAFTAVGQQGKQHLHLLAAVLDIADVVDDQTILLAQALQGTRQRQVTPSGEQLLHQQVAGSEQDPPTLLNQRLSQGTQQMGLAAARVAEGQHVLGAVEEGTFQQHAQLRIHLARQPLAVEGLQALLLRQPGNAVMARPFPLLHHQLQQILLVAQRLAVDLLEAYSRYLVYCDGTRRRGPVSGAAGIGNPGRSPAATRAAGGRT